MNSTSNNTNNIQKTEEPYAFYTTHGNTHPPLPISISLIMTKTFFFMFLALIVSGVASYFTYHTHIAEDVIARFSFTTPLLLLLIVEVSIIFASTHCIRNDYGGLALLLFIAYSVVTGLTISLIFILLKLTLTSIIIIFGITAAVFAIMAIYGYITNASLIDVGTIGIMFIVGVIVWGLTNFILKSNVLDTVLSVIGLITFIGLTAYDTKKIKKMAIYQPELESNTIALYGALNLYIDIINIFISMLQSLARKIKFD